MDRGNERQGFQLAVVWTSRERMGSVYKTWRITWEACVILSGDGIPWHRVGTMLIPYFFDSFEINCTIWLCADSTWLSAVAGLCPALGGVVVLLAQLCRWYLLRAYTTLLETLDRVSKRVGVMVCHCLLGDGLLSGCRGACSLWYVV